jgi:hypothetical protein
MAIAGAIVIEPLRLQPEQGMVIMPQAHDFTQQLEPIPVATL